MKVYVWEIVAEDELSIRYHLALADSVEEAKAQPALENVSSDPIMEIPVESQREGEELIKYLLGVMDSALSAIGEGTQITLGSGLDRITKLF